jgi:NTE family protein
MKYDLVFEGGGAKGIAFAGALEVLEQQPDYTFGRLMGTSAGAITAAVVAAGYSAGEMQIRVAETLNGRPIFANFLEKPTSLAEAFFESGYVHQLLSSVTHSYLPPFIQSRLNERLLRRLARPPTLRQLLFYAEYGGWYAADNFLNWLRQELNRGQYRGEPRNFGGMTLREFYGVTEVELSLAAADITGHKLMILNHITAPDLPLVWAVRMSMSLPFVWQEVVWQKEWGEYRNHSVSGHIIIDGGLLSNFPLELFVSEDARVTCVVGPKESDAVLGLLIDESLAVPGAEHREPRSPTGRINELRSVQRLFDIIDTATSARDKMVIEAFDRLVVRLPAQGYGTTEFDMTEERRNGLIEAGRDAMSAHLARPQPEPDFASFAVTATALDQPAHCLADRIALKVLQQ